eukprot:1705703-Ditylum_brightwellii.AAC.1
MDAITQVIKGQDIQEGDDAYLLVKSLLRGDALQVFKNKEASQEVKDVPVFTKCLAAVMEHEWISQMIKVFPVPDRVTTENIAREEFID